MILLQQLQAQQKKIDTHHPTNILHSPASPSSSTHHLIHSTQQASYFRQVSSVTRMEHLKALAALRGIEQDLHITLRSKVSEDVTEITFIRPAGTAGAGEFIVTIFVDDGRRKERQSGCLPFHFLLCKGRSCLNQLSSLFLTIPSLSSSSIINQSLSVSNRNPLVHARGPSCCRRLPVSRQGVHCQRWICAAQHLHLWKGGWLRSVAVTAH